MFPAIPDQAEHRDQRREIRLHRQLPVPQERPQGRCTDRFLPELGRFMRFARSRPRLSSADLHIVRAEAERLPVDRDGLAMQPCPLRANSAFSGEVHWVSVVNRGTADGEQRFVPVNIGRSLCGQLS